MLTFMLTFHTDHMLTGFSLPSRECRQRGFPKLRQHDAADEAEAEASRSFDKRKDPSVTPLTDRIPFQIDKIAKSPERPMRTQNQHKPHNVLRCSFLRSLCFFLLASPFACRLSLAAVPPTTTDDSTTTTTCDDSDSDNDNDSMPTTTTDNLPLRVLVVGATGATGRHVVAQLLQGNHAVKVIVRSGARLQEVLKAIDPSLDTTTSLTVTEASLLDLTDAELLQQTADVDAVISCLGHTISWKGIYGAPRKLVTEATQRLTAALTSQNNNRRADDPPKKFILMGSDGVADAATDNVRPWGERMVISIIRFLIPPQVDNELAAAHLQQQQTSEAQALEWVIVRPTDLVDQVPEGAPPTYTLYDKPQGSLFGSGTATRSHVAQAMVALVTQAALWNTWKFRMPVLLDDAPAAGK
jgi:nucleoside-diphosphate-sugar epimerase